MQAIGAVVADDLNTFLADAAGGLLTREEYMVSEPFAKMFKLQFCHTLMTSRLKLNYNSLMAYHWRYSSHF